MGVRGVGVRGVGWGWVLGGGSTFFWIINIASANCSAFNLPLL